MPTNQKWSQQLLQTFPDAVSGMLLGVSAPVCDPRDKRALHVNTGAIAVDMESHVVAAVGAAHGLPALFQTAFDALAARATLVRGRRLLGPGLLLVNSLEGEPVTANEPYLGPAIQQQPWKVFNGPRCCAPNTLVEINDSPKSLPLKERIV